MKWVSCGLGLKLLSVSKIFCSSSQVIIIVVVLSILHYTSCFFLVIRPRFSTFDESLYGFNLIFGPAVTAGETYDYYDPTYDYSYVDFYND